MSTLEKDLNWEWNLYWVQWNRFNATVLFGVSFKSRKEQETEDLTATAIVIRSDKWDDREEGQFWERIKDCSFNMEQTNLVNESS